MKNKVFQFVLFYNPEVDSESTVTPAIIVTDLVVAPDTEKAKLLASRKLPAEWESKINDVEVLVRPF